MSKMIADTSTPEKSGRHIPTCACGALQQCSHIMRRRSMAAPVGVLFGLLAPFVLLTLALSGTVWEKAWEKAWLHRAQVGIALCVAMIQNGGN